MIKLTPTEPSAGDYLWDRSGEPDPEIARLESILSVHRQRASPPMAAARPEPAAPHVLRFHSAPEPRVQLASHSPQRLATAAMIALAALAGWLCPRFATGWRVEPVAGAPTLARSTLASSVPLRTGEWLQTDNDSSANIRIADLGQVRVEPGSRARLLPGPDHHPLLDLAHGTIVAFVTAPPRLFQVNTPAARAVDMGCAYTLSVDPDGSGILRVQLGRVLLEWGGRSVTVPMDGGTCLTRPGFGPGTPFFDDATPRFKDELRQFDFESGGEAALNALLSEARPRDGLSLWHLLQSSGPDLRGTIYDRLSQLKPPPDGVIRAGVINLDRAMLDKWWDDMRPF